MQNPCVGGKRRLQEYLFSLGCHQGVIVGLPRVVLRSVSTDSYMIYINIYVNINNTYVYCVYKYIHINTHYITQYVLKKQVYQRSFLVPLIGGRYHIIPQLAVYTTYIPLIYCQLGDYMVPTTYLGNRETAIDHSFEFFHVD